MSEEKFVAYSKIIEVLKMHCAVKDSGTLFITTDSNEAIRFVLESGRIISIAIRRERGILALDAIKNMNAGRFKFSRDATYSVDGTQQLPTTKEIISLLLKYINNSGSLTAIKTTGNSASTSDIENVSSENLEAPPQKIISKETVRSVIEPELIEQMGPVGTMICDEHLENIEELSEKLVIEQVVRNIAIEINSDKFRQNVEVRLFGSSM